jgi:multidrug resistance efflux pump
MKKKTIIIIASSVTLLILLLLIFGKSKSDETESIFTEVKKGNFEVTVAVSGELKAERSEDINGPMELRSPLLGYMQVKIQDLIPEGTIVDSGQYVATLDRTEASNKLKDIEDDIQRVESQYTKSQLDSSINLRSARDNLLNLKYSIEERQLIVDQSKFEAPATIRQSQIELDKTKRNYEQAQQNYFLRVRQYEATMTEVSISLSQVKRRREAMLKLLQKFVIYAPKSGMLIYWKDWDGTKRKVGSIISPWELYVATLPDMSSMLSKTYVNEIDISKIKPGQKVKITLDAFPEKQLTGEVKTVANVGEQIPNTDAKVFEVMIKVNESDNVMRPAMTTSNTIQIAEYNNVLSLPLEAIHTEDSLTFVYTKKSYKQLVLLGQSNENGVIVEKGLQEGEQVWLTIPKDGADMKIKGSELKAEILKKKINENSTVAEDSNTKDKAGTSLKSVAKSGQESKF